MIIYQVMTTRGEEGEKTQRVTLFLVGLSGDPLFVINCTHLCSQMICDSLIEIGQFKF